MRYALTWLPRFDTVSSVDMMFGRNTFCELCGVKVGKEVDYQRSGKHFCSVDHANQYVFEIQKPAKLAKDPVCGMGVDPNKAFHTEIGGKLYYFCGAGCKANFKKTHFKIASKSSPKTGNESKGGGGCCH